MTEMVEFSLPAAKEPCKMFEADDVKGLVNALVNEAKAI